MYYSVFVHERVVTEYIVEADSPETARSKAVRGDFIEHSSPEYISTLGLPEEWDVIKLEGYP